jgi:alpha-beta hydrolase superfamily lysophospholipase
MQASVEHNAWELKQYIEELYWGSGKRVMLLGHSKGGVDAAAALSVYWSDLKDKVAGLALVQSPYGGTPLASDILREGQIGDKETRRIMEFLICKLIKVFISFLPPTKNALDSNPLCMCNKGYKRTIIYA